MKYKINLTQIIGMTLVVLLSCCWKVNAQFSFEKNEIAFLKWGNELGQIGGPLQKDPKTNCSHVGMLSLDGSGKIYIADSENKKVLVLANSGKFLRTIDLNDPSKLIQVPNASADESGNILVPYNDKKAGYNGFSYMYIKPNGERKFYYEKNYTKQSYDNLQQKIIKDESLGDSFLNSLPVKNGVDFTWDSKKHKIYVGALKINERLSKKNRHIEKDKIELDYEKFGSDVDFYLLGIDDDGNVFILFGVKDDTFPGFPQPLINAFVAVFSSDGQLVTKIILDEGCCENENINWQNFCIDTHGDLFWLFYSLDGVHIYKWEKK